MKFKYYKEYIIDVNDVFIDNGACIQFSPKDESKKPWGTWYHKTIYVGKREWKRLLKECIFEFYKDKEHSFVTYYKFIGEKHEDIN